MTIPNTAPAVNLVEKYRPRKLADVIGQDWIVRQLRQIVERPQSGAFILDGPSGCGKTSTALAFAADLGVAVEHGEMGGLYQIASGEQTGDTVRAALKSLELRPFYSAEGATNRGWKVLIVNESDIMSAGAAATWLDGLERLPPKSICIFTTNHADALPRRFRTRCEVFTFEAGALLMLPEVQALVNRVWLAETGRTDAPHVADIPDVMDEEGNVSVRQVMQGLQRFLRDGGAPKAQRTSTAPVSHKAATASTTVDFEELRLRRCAAARKAWATRRAAKEVGRG